jgi:putative ABC transport system permease protein
MIPTPGNFPEEYSRRTAFRDKLLSHREIQKVAFSNGNPGSRHVATAQIKVNDDSRIIGFFNIDPDYLELLGIEMKEGRNFSWDRIGEKFNFDKTDPVQRLPSDKRGVILNEAAIRESEMDSPLGKLIWNNTTEIIGIMQDFHFKSLHDQIGPLAFIWTSPGATANIKIASGDIPASLKMIEKEFKNIYGSVPFSYQFLDESFNTQYRKDEQLATVMGYFSLIAIVIACMGLFALSTFMVNRRTKEIGIRKTLGATVKTIYAMLSWDFLKWILLAAIIACPIGWYVMNKWLESFAYHIKLGPDIFIIAVLIAVGIALLTITWQAIKTARANPVEALRYE